jgi:hypothetical protein
MYLTTHFDRYIETYPDHGDADALRAAQGRFRPVFDVSRDCCGRKGAWSALDSFVGFDFAESKYKKAPEDLVDDIAAIVAQVSESLRRFRRRPDSGTQAAGVKLRVRKYARSVPRRRCEMKGSAIGMIHIFSLVFWIALGIRTKKGVKTRKNTKGFGLPGHRTSNTHRRQVFARISRSLRNALGLRDEESVAAAPGMAQDGGVILYASLADEGAPPPSRRRRPAAAAAAAVPPTRRLAAHAPAARIDTQAPSTSWSASRGSWISTASAPSRSPSARAAPTRPRPPAASRPPPAAAPSAPRSHSRPRRPPRSAPRSTSSASRPPPSSSSPRAPAPAPPAASPPPRAAAPRRCRLRPSTGPRRARSRPRPSPGATARAQ